MFNFKKGTLVDNLRKKIVWITFLVLDTQLHKTSQFEILNNLSAKGYNTTLISIRSKKKVENRKSQLSVISIPLRNIPLVTSFIYSVFIFFFLPFYIIISKPDYIIIQPTIPITSIIPAILLSKVKRVKLVLDIRTITVQEGFRGFLQDFLFKTSILVAKKFFEGITIITTLMKKEICNKYSLDPKRLGVWSSGVSPSLFNPEDWFFNGSKIRKSFGLTNKFVVFYHGAINPNRGLMDTIKAIQLIKQKYPEIVLFLLGSGQLTTKLKEYVQKEQLGENVIFHDPVDYEDVPKFISMSDVTIIPLPDMHYWRSQSPLKLLEYLAMKKVVIISDISAHRAIISNETCGLYMPTVNPEEIAKSITYAFQNREKLQDWGKIGRIIIQKDYTWQKVASDLENYLISIA